MLGVTVRRVPASSYPPKLLIVLDVVWLVEEVGCSSRLTISASTLSSTRIDGFATIRESVFSFRAFITIGTYWLLIRAEVKPLRFGFTILGLVKPPVVVVRSEEHMSEL